MTLLNDHFLIIKKCVQYTIYQKIKFLKKSFILNMDFEEELAPAVVVYILEKKRKEKNGKT